MPSSGGAYTLKKDGQMAAYALPFEGQGFWACIRGIVGIAADKKTVTGITFYEQSETPGLGAEIVRPAFRNQFKGKVLAQKEKPIRHETARRYLGRERCPGRHRRDADQCEGRGNDQSGDQDLAIQGGAPPRRITSSDPQAVAK